MISTVLPDPRLGCQQTLDNPWLTLAFHRCGDCMFSGHTAVVMLFLAYSWSKKTVKNIGCSIALRAWMAVVTLIGIWSILASRAHYTMDILVAAYISMGVWWVYNYKVYPVVCGMLGVPILRK